MSVPVGWVPVVYFTFIQKENNNVEAITKNKDEQQAISF
jgi:hypothetical protein